MKQWLYQRTINIGAFFVRRLERIIARGSRVGNPAFFDPVLFGWTAALEREWPAIRRELEVVLERRDELPSFHEISRDQVRISDHRWKTYFLYAYGFKAEGNCARCPETTRIVESIPGMKTAFFSILGPGKHIPAHRGPYNGVIRCHLGLLVPEPRERCRIRVGSQYAAWEEGRVMLFDDTYEHEVWNNTDGVRVVLFLDVMRPLRFPASVLNQLLLRLIGASPYVQDGVENYKRWEAKFDAMGQREAPAPAGADR
jgi:aspartyl/asparaginyl beta-hydroxylase (cupin superfamily)